MLAIATRDSLVIKHYHISKTSGSGPCYTVNQVWLKRGYNLARENHGGFNAYNRYFSKNQL